jgi:hypothetical protein
MVVGEDEPRTVPEEALVPDLSKWFVTDNIVHPCGPYLTPEPVLGYQGSLLLGKLQTGEEI